MKDKPSAGFGGEIDPAVGTAEHQKTHAAPRDFCSENVVVVITPMPEAGCRNAKEQRQRRKSIQQQSAVTNHDFNMRAKCRKLQRTGFGPSID